MFIGIITHEYGNTGYVGETYADLIEKVAVNYIADSDDADDDVKEAVTEKRYDDAVQMYFENSAENLETCEAEKV